MYRTGVKGTLWAMKAAFPHLKKRGGKIINFGSSGGQLGTKFVGGYNAAKEGVRALSRTAAQEWGQYGINVNIINPMVKTDAMTDWYAARPEQQAADIAKLPLGRVGEIKDVAGVAIFLASSEADFITGMTFMVDGGYLMFA
jgi:NAD(P)-dependent dehydrogenase (short-subunit alcohol dehydrogenase family)